MKYILDTHVWIWWHMNPSKLSTAARKLIEGTAKYEELLLSAISPWEFSKLLEKSRLAVSIDPEEWIRLALQMPKLRLVPLSPILAYRSSKLPPPFHDDPADQIIVAASREEEATLITADERMLSYKHVKTAW